MKTLTIAATLAALTLTTAAPAMADATPATCGQMATKVHEAMNGTDNAEARTEQRAGVAACAAGFYDNGVSHYRKALSLLGK